MELDITKFFRQAWHKKYSASQMELGNDAGKITWRAACDDWEEYTILDSVEKDHAFREHVKDFGAWTDEEIASWDDRELNALCLQMIAGDIREVPGMDTASWDWDEYERLAQRGTISGRMFRAEDGTIYYYIGS